MSIPERASTHASNTRCTPFLLALLVLSAGLTAGCQAEHDPPSLINKLRVLGVRAQPPQVRLGPPTKLDMLVVGHKGDAKLCYAWAFCPIALSLEGNFRCVDAELQTPLGTGAETTLSSAQVQAAMDPDKLKKVLAKHGFSLPSQLDQGGQSDINDIAKQLASFEFFVLFKVADSREFGGMCPTEANAMLDNVCADRTRCLAGYKRLNFAMLPKYYNENPYFDGIELGDVRWPAGVTPTVVPYDSKPSAWDQVLDDGVDAELFEGYGPTALKITPTFDEKIRERTPEEPDENGEPGREEVLFSWFSSVGRYQKQRTYHDFADNLFLAPELKDGESEKQVSLWVVMRDRRNGTAWLHRKIVVKAGKSNPAKILCEIDKTLEGCDDKL